MKLLTSSIVQTFFLFVDNLKLIKIINSHSNAISLQNDLNNVHSCCTVYRLPLNNDKCKFMRFNLINEPINYIYSISNSNIQILKILV